MSSTDPAPWLHVILFEPEIPPNTGNIMRLCANTGAALHLVHPLGFALDEKKLRRAGMDYRDWARVVEHDTLDDALAHVHKDGSGRVFALTTRATTSLFAAEFESGDAVIFGPETRGLPDAYLNTLATQQRLRIPMRPDNRSLNLSNSVAVVVYEAWRQLSFDGAG